MSKNLSSTRNHLIQHLKKVQRNRQYRLSHDSAIIQGKKIFYELYHKLSLKKILTLESETIPNDIDPSLVHIVTESILKQITGLPSPEGILAEVSQPKPPSLSFSGKTLVLDSLQDPGNLGTLIRTSCAFSWDRVIVISPSVDFFNDKVIRGSKGAVFKIPCYTLSIEAFLSEVDKVQIPHYVAHIEGKSYTNSTELPNSFILTLGSEACGPKASLLEKATPLTIPISKQMESLNVAIAGGIIMSHFNTLENAS